MMMKGIGKLAQDLQQQVRDDDYSADINSEDYTLSIHMNGLTGAMLRVWTEPRYVS